MNVIKLPIRRMGRRSRPTPRIGKGNSHVILRTIGFAVALVVLIVLTPAIAQEQDRAPIVVDGQELFQVSDSGDYEAEERAELANAMLEAAVDESLPVDVSVSGRTKLPTLQMNDRLLLTVTERDIAPGLSQLEQAQIWASQIEEAVERAQQQRTTDYLRRAIILAIAIVFIAFSFHWWLGRLRQQVLRPSLQAIMPETDSEEDAVAQTKTINLLLGLLLTIVRTAVWLGASLYISNLFPITRQWTYQFIDILVESFTAPIFSLGQSDYSVIDLLVLAFLLFGVVIASRAVTDLLKSRILQITGVNRGAREAVAIIVRYSLIFLGTLVLLQVWGLDISSLTILASALGVGIGLGLQDIAKDFGSGLVLLFERPIQVGDFIELEKFQGTVEQIGARSTLIRTLDQVSIIVPNSRFLAGEVINWSHDNPVSRIHLPVGVAYGSNIESVRSALLDAARDHSWVLSMPQPQVFFKGFGDSSLDFELLVWTAEPSKQLILKSELYFRIEAQLRAYQVEIPFPQRDLHVRSGTLPVELSPQLEQMLRQLLEQSSNGRQAHSEET